jgi:pyruvate formate lyase activating enzyme
MKIGGLHPFTLSDFPGKTAAILFTIGCNFKCPFCHNTALIDAQHPAWPEHLITEFLHKRKKQLDGIVISGGEPTLQPDLIEFIQNLKTLGYATKLDTNGSHPQVLRELIAKNLLDYIAMDIKAPFEIYDQLTGIQIPLDSINAIKSSIELIAFSNITHEFRTTWPPHLLTQADIEKIKSIVPSQSLYKIQAFVG